MIKIGTINLRGMKQQGKREELERWMTKKNIGITCAQETHVSKNCEYTWYLNGSDEGER